MGRQKLPTEKLETATQRRITFNKRSKCVKEKAKELSRMCDTKMLLIVLSPDGQYQLCHGENSTFDDIVQQYLHETPEKREKSKKDSLQVLKKQCKGDKHALNNLLLMDQGVYPSNKKQGSLNMKVEHIKEEITKIENRLGSLRMFPINKKQGSENMKVEHIKEEITKIENRLGSLRKIDEIDKLERLDEITAIENSIMELLAKNEQEKVHFMEKQQFGCSNSMTVPYEWDNSRCFASTSTTPTNYPYNSEMDRRVLAMLNLAISPYQGDPGASTSKAPAQAQPMLTYPSTGGMDQRMRLDSIPHTFYLSGDSRCSTSAAGPYSGTWCKSADQEAAVMPYSCSFGFPDQQAQLLPNPTAPGQWDLTGDSSLQLSESEWDKFDDLIACVKDVQNHPFQHDF